MDLRRARTIGGAVGNVSSGTLRVYGDALRLGVNLYLSQDNILFNIDYGNHVAGPVLHVGNIGSRIDDVSLLPVGRDSDFPGLG